MMKPRRILQLISLALLGSVLVTAPAAAATVLGQVAKSPVKVDGVTVPTGTTLLSPSMIQTGQYPATVHLALGQSLSIGANTSVLLEATPKGDVRVSPESGFVQIDDGTGEILTVTSPSSAVLRDDEDEDDEGPFTGAAQKSAWKRWGRWVVIGVSSAAAGYVIADDDGATVQFQPCVPSTVPPASRAGLPVCPGT